jgi:hypothetical protein
MVHPDRLLEDLLPYLDKGPKEHHAAQPQKRPRKVDQETPMGKQGKTTVEDEDEELARAVAASLEDNKEVAEGSDATDDMAEAEPEEENGTSLNIKLDYPPLPEEPTGSRDLLCRVAIRLPNNRRIQRNFLHTDPIKVTPPSNFLVSFACFPSLSFSSFHCSSYGHSVLLRLRMERSGLSTLCSPFLEHPRTWSLQVI